jgi:hypothetical protein
MRKKLADEHAVPGAVRELEQPGGAELVALGFPHRAVPARGLGRLLRTVTGVDEDLLDRVWEERARYTGLGTIVLGTAGMAMLSMLDALDQILGPAWPVVLVVALLWGAFICAFDRWLISSTHGRRGSRLLVFGPRILLALLFGVIIATPLVLTVFGSEVVMQAQVTQASAVTRYESHLRACNPLPGQPAPPPQVSCAGSRLAITDPAVGTQFALTQERKNRQELATAVSQANTRIAQAQATSRLECNGTHGAGLSGVPGDGVNCNTDRAAAAGVASGSDVGQLQQQVTTLDQKIGSQDLQLGAQQQAYADAVTKAIGRLVATDRADQGRVGLLNRIDALFTLAGQHPVIAVATVLLALFIVTVDCLPALSKLMSGTTRYDELVEARLRTASLIAAAGLRVSERQATGRDEVKLQRIESAIRARLDEIDDSSRVGRARRDAELDRQITELADEFARQAEAEGA